MTDIFTIKSPLVAYDSSGTKYVVVEIFSHAEGALVFEPFWNESDKAIHIVQGEIYGEGPWKIGGTIFNMLGCGEQDMELTVMQWQDLLLNKISAEEYNRILRETVRKYGGLEI